ncbi:MAG: SIS domain-containing protein [Synergistaceae bacterium]|nr:SIS domain-containing protein [Synergistaceae bacterium]
MSICVDADSIKNVALAAIKNDARAVECAASAVNEAFVRVVHLLSECPGKVIVTGSGTSGAVAKRAAHLLSVGGTPSFFLSPGDGLHGGLGAIGGEDVIIAISKGGSSSELNEFCARGKELGRALVVITSERDSPLAGLADHVLVILLEPQADLGTVIATGSSLAAGALLDGIVEACRVVRGYDWKSFFFTHPGGAVGKNAELALDKLAGTGGNFS